MIFNTQATAEVILQYQGEEKKKPNRKLKPDSLVLNIGHFMFQSAVNVQPVTNTSETQFITLQGQESGSVQLLIHLFLTLASQD